VLAAGHGEDFSFSQQREAFQFPLPQEGIEELFFNGTYEVPSSPTPAPSAVPVLQPAAVTPSFTIQPASLWDQSKPTSTNKRVHVPPERETKVKKRKQQHQQKDKERRHKINDGLKQLGNLVQSATNSFARLDQPTIVTSSIGLIRSLQSEIAALRAQLSGSKEKDVKEEKHALINVDDHHAHAHHQGACPVFTSVAGAGVALIMIRADDLSIVEANSVLANILGYSDSTSFVGTAVWDKPLHSRLYQLDRHGRIVNDNSNPFAAQPKVKVEDGVESQVEDSHIDCLWTARTANGNTLSARVTLSVLKGDDAKPTHFLLCSLPSQRSVSPTPSAVQTVQTQNEVECAC